MASTAEARTTPARDTIVDEARLSAALRAIAESTTGEIVVSDDVLSAPGAAKVIAGLATEAQHVELRGVAGPVDVHRIRR